jgi:toxin FitB
MGYLLDTNVLSELRRGRRCDLNVATWARSTANEGHFISVLSLGEIRKGIEILHRRSPEQAEQLEIWLSKLESGYLESILPVSNQVSQRWGRLNAQRTLPVIDGLLAATASEYRLTVATRNTADFAGAVAFVNPFLPPVPKINR